VDLPATEQRKTGASQTATGDLVRAYSVYLRMMKYPKLVEKMREIFVRALQDNGVITPEEIEAQAIDELNKSGRPTDKKHVREYSNALIDLYFANHFSHEQIENHINLARKLDRFQTLTRVVNTEGATSLKIKKSLKEFCEIPEGDLYVPPNEAIGTRVALINHFISNQLPFISIAKNHITIRDIDDLVDQSYWSRRRPGRIGGKAAGMLLAYKIIMPRLSKRDPELERYVEIPDSFYLNSGIFSDFLDHNDLHRFHSQKYKSREEIEKDYKTMARLFRKSSFPPDIKDLFRDCLEKVGEHPIILRSSSLLEDNFGYAFSGKYDSVFLANQGDLETRLNEFIWGLKRVHMSTFGPAPILYRRDHNLLDFDEKMCVLVQKVVGRRYGDYFFPFAAGVAYSYNIYGWTPRIKKEDGLVRLVFGLGTRAVDRISNDYPRMIALSHPHLRPEVNAAQIMKYSQKMVDLLNLREGRLETVPFIDLARTIDHPDLHDAVSVNQDGHLAAPMFRSQEMDPSRSCLTFQNFLGRTPFVGLMKKILSKLDQAYGRPVDIEFAWDNGKLFLLQCRTLSIRESAGPVPLPTDIAHDDLLFTNRKVVMNSVVKDIEYIVYVDPKAYGRLESYEQKIAVGRLIGRLNRYLEDHRYALFGPGRWGSNDITLGVKVGYEDINRTLILGEIAFEDGGSTPDVSYGTHFFNDLIEARIVPIALYPDQEGVVFREDYFLGMENALPAVLPDWAHLHEVVHLIHVPACTDGRFLQVYQNGQEQQGMGFFGPPEGPQEDANY
jgi:hypothetical protein